jgi:hypothetical protein
MRLWRPLHHGTSNQVERWLLVAGRSPRQFGVRFQALYLQYQGWRTRAASGWKQIVVVAKRHQDLGPLYSEKWKWGPEELLDFVLYQKVIAITYCFQNLTFSN